MVTTRARRGLPLAVASLCLVQFMDVLGVTVVVTALPSMLSDLHAPQSLGSLIATGYSMFFGGLLMLGARLGDKYGHRRTILASLAVFAVGAVVAATACSSVVWLAAEAVPAGRGRRDVGALGAEAADGDGDQRRPGPAPGRSGLEQALAGAAAGASGFVCRRDS